MEEEERAAQSAKLQELIRRGTPRDLQEANKLMKVMAGFDQRNKTDYRAKAAEEVSGVQQKARLLEEMLQSIKQGDKIKEGDVFEELANALASAHPKIQKMCEEESDDHEAVAKLLEINDSIHRTIQRYKLVRKGDIDGAEKIPKGTLGISGAGVKTGSNNELSLIDFNSTQDESKNEPSASSSLAELSTSSGPTRKGNALEDDLIGLSIGNDKSYGQGGGGIFLGMSSSGTNTPLANPQSNAINSMNSIPQTNNGSTPNYNLLSGLTNSSQNTNPAVNKPGSSTSSPFQFQQSTFSPPSQPSSRSQTSSSLLGMLNDNKQLPVLPSNNNTNNPKSPDDEWVFTSSLPPTSSSSSSTPSSSPSTLPLRNTMTVLNTCIKAVFEISRPPLSSAEHDSTIHIQSVISSNLPASLIDDLTFQVAVTKVCRPLDNCVLCRF